MANQNIMLPTETIAHVADYKFENWAQTVENTPNYAFTPKTKEGICNIVKWAKQNNKRVRVAGYRHTWESLFSDNDEVLILFVSKDEVPTKKSASPDIEPFNELQEIKIIKSSDEKQTFCKIGAATTNEQFRRWCVDANGGNSKWTVPLNVIMVEITWGGSNGTISHGAGLKHKTLSDLVTEIEFVNANGELQTVKDPELIKTAAGCFGLLGIVTSLTIKLEPMTYANMKPTKPNLGCTIPPPEKFEKPKYLDEDDKIWQSIKNLTQKDKNDAWKKFVDSCENDYYCEWFWFPYQENCWVNTWKNDGNQKDAKPYPSEDEIKKQQELAQLFEVSLNQDLYSDYTDKKITQIIGTGAMINLPPKSNESGQLINEPIVIVTPLIDALHFRHGIHNFRVLDMEIEIPIPPIKDHDNKPDWTVCQKAWWDAISVIYNYDENEIPPLVTLEMRIMGGSDIIMAPEYGNSLGTCSIEILSLLKERKKDKDEQKEKQRKEREKWLKFMQEILNKWSSYTYPDGKPLNIRPHWGKQWTGLKIRGKDIIDYLKNEAYKTKIEDFKKNLDEIGKIPKDKYNLQDLKSRFSNPLLDKIFF